MNKTSHPKQEPQPAWMRLGIAKQKLDARIAKALAEYHKELDAVSKVPH